MNGTSRQIKRSAASGEPARNTGGNGRTLHAAMKPLVFGRLLLRRGARRLLELSLFKVLLGTGLAILLFLARVVDHRSSSLGEGSDRPAIDIPGSSRYFDSSPKG